MEKSKSKKYDKLIRDKIPEIIEAGDSKALIEVLDNERFKTYLDIKLVEELKEYLESDSVEELADLVEVIYALLDYKDIAREQFEKVRIAKAEKRGMFKKRLLLKEVIEI